MTKQLLAIVVLVFIGGVAYFYAANQSDNSQLNDLVQNEAGIAQTALAAKFDYLSQNGNSSCSASFRSSISSMSDGARLQGSCCSPMSPHRYSEQVDGLEKFKSALRQAQGGEQSRTIAGQNIDKIPDDPYDINAGLAKELMSYYEMELTYDEQKAYDYAMQNSSEKGPCCCKCWRWYVYGGLGKLLIRNYGFTPLEARVPDTATANGGLPLTGFTGEQLTEVWNLSDGCGGDDEHHH